MITRIITVGPQRLGNLILSLYYDCYIYPIPDTTVIITPLDKLIVSKTIKQSFPDLDFSVINDAELLIQYPDIQLWNDEDNTRAGWLKQQALKLVAIDHCQSDMFLIQDPDTFCIKDYQYFDGQHLRFFVVLNQHHYDGYYQTLDRVLKINRQTTDSFVTEIMPVLKNTWQQCKQRIEQTINASWLTLINHVPYEPLGKRRFVRWFSEYELLGNWHIYSCYENTCAQHRFVFNNLETLNHLNSDYNVVCDRGINGQVKGLPSMFGDGLSVNFDIIEQARSIIGSKNIC